MNDPLYIGNVLVFDLIWYKCERDCSCMLPLSGVPTLDYTGIETLLITNMLVKVAAGHVKL